MKFISIVFAAILSGILISSCKSAPEPEKAATSSAAANKMSVAEIESPAPTGSAEPNLSTGPDGHVYLSWIESENSTASLKFSVLDGEKWTPAGTVATGQDWFINSSDFPSLIAMSNGTLAAHWLGNNKEGTEAYNVNIAISRDNGKTWSKPFIPHSDRSVNEHGFVSLVALGPAQLGAVWLDGKKIKDEVGDMALLYTTMDLDGKVGKETVLDGRVCECCQTSAAVTPDGLIVAYRDRSDKEIRDISTIRQVKDNWTASQIVNPDNWEIDGCPVNGPAVSASGNNAAVAWFTAPHDDAQVNVALSSDGGKTFGHPIRVDGGTPVGRVGVASLESGGALVSWVEQADSGTQVRLRRVEASGALAEALIPSEKSSSSFTAVPRITRSGNRVVVAWTDKEKPSKVHTATVKLD